MIQQATIRRRLAHQANATRRPPSKLIDDDKSLKVTGQAAKKIEKLQNAVGKKMPEVDNGMVFIKNEKMIYF